MSLLAPRKEVLLSDICCKRRSTTIAYDRIFPYQFENEAPRPSSTRFQMFYLVMILCSVNEKSCEEQIIPSEGWDLGTNTQNHFLFASFLDALGIEQEKELLLLLGCSLFESCFDCRALL